MSLSKSKCWYSKNCLYFLKHAVPLTTLFFFKMLDQFQVQFFTYLAPMQNYFNWFPVQNCLLDLFATLRINDIQPNQQSVIMLSVALNLLICSMSLNWLSFFCVITLNVLMLKVHNLSVIMLNSLATFLLHTCTVHKFNVYIHWKKV
jgi:hypothetical protein